jgi:hypothetical protein
VKIEFKTGGWGGTKLFKMSFGFVKVARVELRVDI